MFNKVNINNIIKDHLSTLKNDNTGKPDKEDILLFFLMPLLLSSVLVYLDIFLSDKAINIVITALAIFVGLLFNVIVLIFDLVSKNSKRPAKIRLLREILANISFSVLLCIIIIALTLLTFIDIYWIMLLAHLLAYFLILIFMINLFMILKRMYNLFAEEI